MLLAIRFVGKDRLTGLSQPTMLHVLSAKFVTSEWPISDIIIMISALAGIE
jgi:hypothetical protein